MIDYTNQMEEVKVSGIDILYKYRHFESEYHLRMITHNELYLALRRELNDPHEMAYNLDLKDVSKEKLEQWISKSQKCDNLSLSNEEFSQLKCTIPTNLNEMLSRARICSFVGDDCLNPLMWAHYSNSHKGYCLGINYFKFQIYLYTQLLTVETPNVLLAKVIYEESKEDPVKTFINSGNFNTLRIAVNKSKIWEYENEIRLVHFPVLFERINIPDECISEVVLGLQCSDTNIEITKAILRQKKSDIKLYQVYQIENSYEFDKKEIEYK